MMNKEYENLAAEGEEFIIVNLRTKYNYVRSRTELLCRDLEPEDYVIQSMTDASPAKWHLAHTSWFFETFVIKKFNRNYNSPFYQYDYLFNSYYIQAGERFTRNERGMLSRPTVAEVYRYRKFIDEEMNRLMEQHELPEDISSVIIIGINHEQQHQELLLTDIKHLFSRNPLYPIYSDKNNKVTGSKPDPLSWINFQEGIYEVGFNGSGFCYDNEMPRHKVFINNFSISDRLVTNGEYMTFIDDGGYKRPEIWLSDGTAAAEQNGWTAPLYWFREGNEWYYFTLHGRRKVDENEPVCHVSYYEADAYARWAGINNKELDGCRLLTEPEWETAAADARLKGNFMESENYHPIPLNVETGGNVKQLFGDVWEWTGSAYLGYPGYRPPEGALGEYNGKFMSGQMVLKGGSCATPESHIRKTYRNFFNPSARWQFTGIRLAK